MSLRKTFFLMGVWVAIIPLLGFPSSIRSIILAITGIGIVLLSYSIKKI